MAQAERNDMNILLMWAEVAKKTSVAKDIQRFTICLKMTTQATEKYGCSREKTNRKSCHFETHLFFMNLSHVALTNYV